ncbi:MAG TPA: glycosyltransferase family 4 protein [Candidatus Limnocylindrales bacterium]|nr:glycosyltransferase family 4 protein [Candidatus Limnocylindrales bacterium]
MSHDPRGTVVVVSPYRLEYGPPQTLGHVALALAEAGYRPVCVVPPGARITADVQRAGADVHELPGLRTFPRTLNAGRLTAFLREHLQAAGTIRALAERERAQAIYSISEATFAGALAARTLGVPSIVHVIGMSIQQPRLGAHVYVRMLARLTTHFIACSSAVAEMLARYGVRDEAVTVVHNGIAVDAIDATVEAEAIAAGDGAAVGMVAAYDPRKGHDLFVETAALVAARHPATRFFLIGGVLQGQPESEAYACRIGELIRAHGLESRFFRSGYVPSPDVYRWIRAMDIVVVPSRTEAFAHALPEAMLCGAAVVATAIEGNLDAFVHDHSGLYAEPDARSLADAVCSLIADPARAAALGEAARRRARLFDVAVTIPALAETVASVLEAPASAGRTAAHQRRRRRRDLTGSVRARRGGTRNVA